MDESDVSIQSNLNLKFTGNGKDYFKVWSVNLLFNLITLGIYSPWAKIRKKRYFYAHTTVDGSPFQYTAKPIPILKGRIFAAFLFAAYYIGTEFINSLLAVVVIAGLIVAPWMFLNSIKFNAAYSRFRNINFSVEATYLQSTKAFYFLGIIPLYAILTSFGVIENEFVLLGVLSFLALLLPFWYAAIKNFIVTRTQFGRVNGTFNATYSGMFFITLRAVFLGGILFLLSFASTFIIGLFPGDLALKFPLMPLIVWFFIGYTGYVFALAYYNASMNNFIWTNVMLGPLVFQSELNAFELFKIYIKNICYTVVSLGVYIPYAIINTRKYRLDNMQILQNGSLDEFKGAGTTETAATGAELSDFFNLDFSL